MAQHDAGGTGATSTAGPTRNPTKKWSVEDIGSGITPVVSGTTTYANDYALRTTNRDGIWTAEMDTPPTVTGTTLYTTRGENVVALKRSDATVQWSWSPNDPSPDLALRRPVLYDGSLYVPYKTESDQGDLYALDAVDGSTEWKYDHFLGDPMAPPAVSEDRVFVSVDKGADERMLRAFDRSDGTHLWDQSEGATSRQPSYRDGIVYTEYAEAIDTTTGAVRWSFDFEEGEYGNSVAVSEGTVVAVGTYGDDAEADPNVYGLGRDGSQRWSFEISEVDTGPAIADGVAYVGPTDEGVVYAIDTESGEELWSYDLGTAGTGTSLAVANGVLYVPTADGTLYAITEGENEPPDPSIEYYPPDPVVGEPVSFDGTGSTDDTGITDFAWSVSGPASYQASGPRASTTLNEPGEYELTLTVTDDNGTSASADEPFSVRPEPTETETETETEVDEGTTAGSDQTTAGSGETATDTENDEIRTDSSETTATTPTTGTETVGEVSASFTFRPTGPPVGETVEFDASGSETPAAEIVAYEWDFDNGETAAGQQVSQTFEEVGHFFVELTVTDSNGTTATTEQEVRTVRGGASASGPGFGLTSALASLGGVGYLLKRRFDDE